MDHILVGLIPDLCQNIRKLFEVLSIEVVENINFLEILYVGGPFLHNRYFAEVRIDLSLEVVEDTVCLGHNCCLSFSGMKEAELSETITRFIFSQHPFPPFRPLFLLDATLEDPRLHKIHAVPVLSFVYDS